MRSTQYIIIVSFLIFQSFVSNGQNRTIDSLKQILQTQKEDTDRVNTLNLLSIALSDNGDQNEAMKITDNAILISKNVNFKKGEAMAYSNKSVISFKEGDYLASLSNSQSAIKIFHDAGLKFEEAQELDWAGGTYQQQYNYEEASRYFGDALKLYKELKNNGGIARTYTYMGDLFGSKKIFQKH
jgi:tetratricopeptide (TPR) repeat protein